MLSNRTSTNRLAVPKAAQKWEQHSTFSSRAHESQVGLSKIKYQDQSQSLDQSHIDIRETGANYSQDIDTTQITEYQQNIINKDSSHLYLKDVRTFLGLKKVAQTQNKRKF
jgi:hypothetical protein